MKRIDREQPLSPEQREAIQRVLDLPPHQDISVLLWHSPREALPVRYCRVLVKKGIRDGLVCLEAIFEQGRFWYLEMGREFSIAPGQVSGWAYLPDDTPAEL